MQPITAILTLAAVAVAIPLDPPVQCTPATYACATNPKTNAEGWKVCDVTNEWVVS